MNGPADVGGAHGFGPVAAEQGEPVFHADWERSVFALSIAAGTNGLWTLDRSRYMRESLPHAMYYDATYYEIWFAALERLVAEAVEDGRAPKRVLSGDAVRPVMAGGFPATRSGPEPRFAVGDEVRVRSMRPANHTRAPSYVRGHAGRIAALRGCHVLPDTNAHGAGENPTPLYNVAFDAAELWGADTTAAAVHVDLFETYLEPAR